MSDPDHPSESQIASEAMRSRRLLLKAAIGGGIVVASLAAWDFHCWERLDANCYSDTMYYFYGPLNTYLEEQDNVFPPADQLVSIASRNDKAVPRCPESNGPYRWNLLLAGQHLENLEGQVVTWCPPGSHGRYTTAMLVEDGRLTPRVLTASHLRQQLSREGIAYK